MMNAGDKFIISFVKYSIKKTKYQLNAVTTVCGIFLHTFCNKSFSLNIVSILKSLLPIVCKKLNGYY